MSPIVLIGPPGSGKSTTGRQLAAALEVNFRDTDVDVERAAGKPIAEIFFDEGEAHFRELEREAVASALQEHQGVLALGGGAILDTSTQELLEGHRVVFLNVSLAAAAPRVGFNTSRPLLVGNPRRQWRELMEARRPTYERLADLQVQTSGRPHAEVVAEIVEWAQQR